MLIAASGLLLAASLVFWVIGAITEAKDVPTTAVLKTEAEVEAEYNNQTSTPYGSISYG
jgi:hypothetical protein